MNQLVEQLANFEPTTTHEIMQLRAVQLPNNLQTVSKTKCKLPLFNGFKMKDSSHLTRPGEQIMGLVKF